MSSIEKMSIQGIRSFGWTDQDKQIIAFFSPLTLILGPNGTGKTTIIESLRYITTGDMPPGCSRGGAFVHDPKVADEREVKGQIRLQFKDVNKKTVIVTRSLLALQKEKRIECKTIDGVLTTEGHEKEKISISSKCAQLDQQMSSLLGVSKAILNNVVFCHQEDSTWPLGEGKLVKTKFDDIFAATRYIKALDAIKKSRMELETGIRECRLSAKYLKENKTIAEKMSDDLTKTKARLTASLDSINKIKERLKPLESRLEIIMTKQSEIFELQINIANLESKKQQIEKMQRELKDKMEHEYPGDMKELQKLQTEFQAEVRKNEKTLNKLEKQMDLLDQQSKRLQKIKASLNQEVGKRKMEAEAHKEKIKQQKDIIKSLSTEYELKGFEDDITEDKVAEFNEQLSQLIKLCVSDEHKVRSKFEDQEAKLQKKLDNVRDAKSKLEQTIHIKKETVSKNEMEIKRLTRELSTIAASTTKLEQLEHALSKAEYELNDVAKSVDINSLKSEISEFKDQRIQLNAKLDQLNFEINKCHLQNSTRTELDLLKKDKTSKEDKIRKLIARHEDTLKHLLGHVPSENIRYKLDSFIQKQYESSHALTDQIQKSRVKLSSKEVNRKLLTEQLKKKEEELKEFEEKLFQLCGSQDFDQGVDLLESSLGSLQDEKGALSGMQHLYKKYIELIRQSKPCCPLCHRGFDEQQDVEELIHELESKLRLIPKQLELKEKSVNEQQFKYNHMVAMKPNIAAIKTLQEKSIPDLKQQVKELNSDIEGLRLEISENEDCLQMKQTDEAVAKSIQTDMVLLDQAQNDIKNLDKTIAALVSKLGSSPDSLRTLQQVNSEKNDVQMEFDTFGRKIDSKQQKINDHTEHLHELHKTVNEMKEEKLQISSNLQKRNQLEESKLELTSVIEQCKNEISENNEKLQPLAVSLDSIQEEKQNLLSDKNIKINNMQQKLNKIKSNRQHVDLFSKEIERYLINGGPEALITSDEELKDIEGQLDTKEADKQAVSVEIDDIRKNLAQEQVRVRELQDTVQLRQWDEEIVGFNADITTKSKQLGDFHGTALEKEKVQLDNVRRKLIKEKDQADGRQNELQTNISKIQKDLENDPYKDVDVKYKKNLIQLRTTELASKDLVKYHKALDGAIMRFHSMKMEEINKIIRDLWRNTYRGTDIDYIEICSDADEAGNSSDTLRRVYHYRVVMVKGDKKLDMRGRCSAGQKVLASLIIRLALAETFCLNCGILALDEPTTNLDRDNIESLAHALVEIIKNRSKQRNFQLIIITHDEDFVELLGRSDYVDYYYRVHKNRDGLSQVERCTIQGLQM